jgi:Protein of unknown function (DUF3160)
VAVVPLASEHDDLATLTAKLRALDGLTPRELLARHAIAFSDTLGYDPLTAKGMELIQASNLRLDAAEQSKLSTQGFVISKRSKFPTMADGLSAIYAADLPVYVSLDAILDAVHVSYDAILKGVEEAQLIADVRTMLGDARTRLRDAALAQDVATDLDVYFTVALSLLETAPVAAIFPANQATVTALVAGANKAEGFQTITLFDVAREYDFSQLEPRGHYADSAELGRYFRAMMWLGRTDLRLIETLPDGSSIFRRRQFDAMCALAELIQGEGRAAYERIDTLVGAFVGEHDYMQLSEVAPLLDALGGAAAAAQANDQTVAQSIVDGGFGAQRIASQIIMRDPGGADTLPIGRSFALLGQRYVVDSHVLSNVVYDRVPCRGEVSRRLPMGLDVAYAALANSSALPLLADELTTYGYAPQLEQTRALVDAHGDAYWDANLYNLWLSALRAVSPTEGTLDPGAAGQPALTGSEAWNRRMLNTQLGSWAELRHDTILYAKQSYTSGVECEFPDGYVDPYPAAFRRLEAFAAKGGVLAELLAPGLGDRVRGYFAELAQVTAMLRTIAEQEATGTALDAAQLAFLNDAVRTSIQGCGGPTRYEGWYARLFFTNSSDEMDPTIADVHTDAGDNAPPQVLYAATGLPRLMVVTRESCSGPRAYAGVVFAYHEFSEGLPRLDDTQWLRRVNEASDVPFMTPILP